MDSSNKGTNHTVPSSLFSEGFSLQKHRLALLLLPSESVGFDVAVRVDGLAILDADRVNLTSCQQTIAICFYGAETQTRAIKNIYIYIYPRVLTCCNG